MFGLNAGEDIVLVAACSRAVKKGRRPVAVNSLAGLPIYQRDRAVVIRFEDIRVIRLHMEPPVRIVVPPQPCTFRKYCAQSEKRVTSPNCKQTTQPSGAATPRDSDAHHAHRCPEGSLRSSGAHRIKAQKRQSTPFCPLATQGFRNV